MGNDTEKVIVTVSGTAGSTQVHHRDFPEIRAEGGSPAEAAGHLANQLSRTLDSALTNWRRETIQQAIADVNAFTQEQK